MPSGIRDFSDETGVADFSTESDELVLKVMNVEYTEHNSRTITHLFGRDEDGEYHHVEVVGHRPSFFILEDEYDQRVENHYAVYGTEKRDEDGERYTNLHGEPLVRVYTYVPGQVADLRELFGEHYEADVLYTKRWLIDTGVYTGARIDMSGAVDDPWVKGEGRVDIEAVEPLSRDETPSLGPKKVVVDIEIAGEGSVPDADRAEYPVSTIVAWDSDSEAYVGWLLRDGPTHIRGDLEMARQDAELDDLRTFYDESEMLYDFNEWLASQRPDIITGWYSNDFDIPYLVNRCRDLSTWNYQDWSPLGEVFISKYEPVIKGVSCVDMIGAYKKTQIHKLKQKGLDDIAEKEGVGRKEEIDMDHTDMWRENPVEFLKYNKVDVELVNEIDEAVGATELLDNLRHVVGCSYSDPIGGNIDMMDVLFLRKAREYGMALPTAEKPDVGDYFGAYVYTPEAGLHENVVYPDYSSLYPNIMHQCNISPETLVGTAEDLEASEYDESDVVWSYVDVETPPSIKPDIEAKEERMEKLYYLKPSVEEGFVRSVLDDIMGLASEYTGGMYEAVKRVRSSCYGVMGDSDSYNRGFRLFDWRIAESITLGGQKILKEGGRVFEEMVEDPEARVIYGDTDSVVTTMPTADSPREALHMATEAADNVNRHLDDYAADIFGLEGPEEARMDLEIESVADGIFFKGDDKGRSDDGVKKRYAQRIVWDDEEGWYDDPDLKIKGFEYVRSDIANVTAKVQKQTFQMILDLPLDEAEAEVKEYVRGVVEDIMSGDMDENEFGIPFGIRQDLSQYGSVDRKPQPQYRGAKYANSFIYGERAITSGDKPLYFYIRPGYTGSHRKTYKAKTKEDGLYVDCISVLDARDIPDGFTIDRKKMIEKTIVGPMEAIFRTLGWGVEWLERAIEDATPPEYYRDEEQSGLSAAEFM